MKILEHHHLLDGKSIIDNAMPDLEDLRELIPEKLHEDFDHIIRRFEDTLVSADQSSRIDAIFTKFREVLKAAKAMRRQFWCENEVIIVNYDSLNTAGISFDAALQNLNEDELR